MEELKIESGLQGSLGSLTELILQAKEAYAALGKAAEEGADGQKQLAKAVRATRSAVKRTLMAFDKINKLSAPTGGSSRSSGSKASASETPETLKDRIAGLVDKVLKLLQPMLSLDTNPVIQAFRNFWNAVEPVFKSLGGQLQWLWQQILSPFMRFLVEQVAPVMGNGFAGALGLVSTALDTARGALTSLWERFRPTTELVDQQASPALEKFGNLFSGVAQTIQEKAPWIQSAFTGIGEKVHLAGEGMGPVFETIGGFFRSVSDTAASVAGKVVSAFGTITGYLSGTFAGGWSKSWEGIRATLKGVINGLIGLVNSMLSALGSGINNVIRAANKVKFTVPSWVPGLGGKTYGFSMSTVSVPSVPYLAQGAVLPANRPFLAVVGDQRHGTNVEAPLSTIQEAVASVMGADRSQEAVVNKLSQILEAVLGIRLGDREVYEAQDRYRKRMAMIHGGI